GLVDHGDFLDAAQRALEPEASLAELAVPAALGRLSERVKPPGDILRCRRRPYRIAGDLGTQHAGNSGLLDDLAIVAAVQATQQIADGARFLDQRAQVIAGAHFAGR